MADVFLLSPAQMKRIKFFFPLSHGIPRVDDRRVVSGIVFVIRNGLRWRDAMPLRGTLRAASPSLLAPRGRLPPASGRGPDGAAAAWPCPRVAAPKLYRLYIDRIHFGRVTAIAADETSTLNPSGRAFVLLSASPEVV
jgi:hypothetical protein